MVRNIDSLMRITDSISSLFQEIDYYSSLKMILFRIRTSLYTCDNYLFLCKRNIDVIFKELFLADQLLCRVYPIQQLVSF